MGSIRLTLLLNGILDLKQKENGGPTRRTTPLDPETVIHQAMEVCEALAHAAGVTLQRPGRTRGTRISGNRDRPAQVFINLISNAIKYNTSGRPVVTISSVLHGDTRLASLTTDRQFRKASASASLPSSPAAPRRVSWERVSVSVSRQIVEGLDGELSLSPRTADGAEFVVRFTLSTTACNN
jgi:signal transduction histidine kinase